MRNVLATCGVSLWALTLVSGCESSGSPTGNNVGNDTGTETGNDAGCSAPALPFLT